MYLWRPDPYGQKHILSMSLITQGTEQQRQTFQEHAKNTFMMI